MATPAWQRTALVGLAVGALAFTASAQTQVIPLSPSDLGALLSGSAGMGIVFDHYVSHPQPEPWPGCDSCTIRSFPSPFTGFLYPSADNTTFDASGEPGQQLPPGVGVVVERSGGPVEFSDLTSGPTTCDINAPWSAGDGTLTIRFVNLAAPQEPATVSRVAFRFGSVDSVPGPTLTFLDTAGNVIGQTAVPFVPADVSSAGGWRAMVGFAEVSRIHAVVLSSTAPDQEQWLLGSFFLEPTASLIDLAWDYCAQCPTDPCRADWNGDGHLTPSDVGRFVTDWFGSLTDGTLLGDYDHNGAIQPSDIGTFVNAWAAAVSGSCPP